MKTMIKKMKTAGLGLAVVCAFISLSSARLVNAGTNFSGQWVLNTSKSDLGQFGARMSAPKMSVTADANGMTVEKTINGQNGEAKTTDKLTFDGKESSNPFFGTSTKVSTTKWSDDGKTLNVTWKASIDYNGTTTTLSGTEAWTLSADGAILTIASTSVFGANPAVATKLVYDKAK